MNTELLKKKEYIVRQLFEVLCQRKPLSFADNIIDINVKGKMDNYAINSGGRESWQSWIKYAHLHLYPNKLDLQINQVSSNADDHIHLLGISRIIKNDDQFLDNPFDVEFYFEGERIVKICTKKMNYVGFFGQKFKHYPWAILYYIKFKFYQLTGKV